MELKHQETIAKLQKQLEQIIAERIQLEIQRKRQQPGRHSQPLEHSSVVERRLACVSTGNTEHDLILEACNVHLRDKRGGHRNLIVGHQNVSADLGSAQTFDVGHSLDDEADDNSISRDLVPRPLLHQLKAIGKHTTWTSSSSFRRRYSQQITRQLFQIEDRFLFT